MINSNPSLVLSYGSNMTLHDYLKQNQVLTTEFITRVLSSLRDGVLYLHRKGVLHNQIVTANICLRYQSQVYEPVLIGFSYFCRADTAKPLTITQQQIFKHAVHLPVEVRNGAAGPSFYSDVYSFEHLCQSMVAHFHSEKHPGFNAFVKSASECLVNSSPILQDFEDLVDYCMCQLD